MAAKPEVRPRPLKVDAITSSIDIGFWDGLCGLKLDVLGTDDSPIPITGYYTPSPHPKRTGLFRLNRESVAPSYVKSFGSKNDCLVPGTLINTNNMLGFQNLDVASLLKEEGKKKLMSEKQLGIICTRKFRFPVWGSCRHSVVSSNQHRRIGWADMSHLVQHYEDCAWRNRLYEFHRKEIKK